MSITIESRSFNRTWKQVLNWAKNFDGKPLSDIVEKVTKDYKEKFKDGKDGHGQDMLRVRQSTMDMPIRYGGPDSRIRREVNSSRKPLNATGETIRSIKKKKVRDGYEIGASTSHGRDILAINVKPRAIKSGGTVPARDPLVAGEKQLDIIEAELIKSLEKALR